MLFINQRISVFIALFCTNTVVYIRKCTVAYTEVYMLNYRYCYKQCKVQKKKDSTILKIVRYLSRYEGKKLHYIANNMNDLNITWYSYDEAQYKKNILHDLASVA